MKTVTAAQHYDLLVQEGNDPANDPPLLQEYMNKWDGPAFIEALALTPDSEVLEIGAGTGRLGKKVLETGCRHFTGIDISPAAIMQAEKNLSIWDNVSLICDEFINHSFTQMFHVIYCSLTLFHFQDKRGFIEKAASLLQNGRIVLSVPKEKESSIDFDSRTVPLYPDDPAVIKSLLTQAGLTICSTIEVEFAFILTAEKT